MIIDPLSERLDKGLKMTRKWGWLVVSMKNDGKYIF